MRLPIFYLPVVALMAAFSPGFGAAQERGADLDAYFRAVGDHFGVSPQEVSILSEWQLLPDEVPVVLFIARKGGVSPDAVVAYRKGGRSWHDLATRFEMDAGDFHVPVGEASSLGSLSRVYEEYRSRSASSWSGIVLQDGEVVGLVNVAVLSDVAGVPPSRVVEIRDREGSFVAAYRVMVTGR